LKIQEDLTMKKIIKATLAVATTSAALMLSANTMAAASANCGAGTLCEVTVTTPVPTEYIQEGFALQLSPGVALNWVQSATAVGVGAFHPKGNSGFAGISNGGQIIDCGTTAAMPTVTSSLSGATGCDS
jgi:hypothetical protein